MEEDLATLGFVLTTLSLSVFGIVLFEDCCICSYEAHLNIKEGIHNGVFSRKGFPKEILCLLCMLFTLLYIALPGYIYMLSGKCSWLYDILLK